MKQPGATALKDEVISLTDAELATRFGDYASFVSDASPAAVETYGEDPRQEMLRLLGFHIKPDSCILDVGCGAGQTVCQLAPMVAEAWGFDEEPLLLNRARRRVQELALTNVTLLEGNVAVPDEVAQLPEHHFDVIFSERGPGINEALKATLKPGGVFLQELVGGYDGYHLPEILGRRPFTAYAYRNQESHRLAHAAELNLRPISIKEFFYDAYFRDVDHLADYLAQSEMPVSNWRLPPKPYDAARDRAALELYGRYNRTAQGIRLLQHRYFFVWLHTPVHYYPIDAVLQEDQS